MRPVVIDCSAGAYEGLALYLASKSGLDIRAVTTNGIWETPDRASRQVSGLCRAFGIAAPVVSGAAEPIIAHRRPVVDCYPRLSEDAVPPGPEVAESYAWDEIYRQACAAEGELRLICLGPLTNVAIALFKYPELKDLVGEVVFFGGALDWGNVSQTAENNVLADPHAADALIKSGMKITMVPWSESRKVGLRLPAVENPVVKTLARAIKQRQVLPLEEPMVLNHGLAVLYAAGCEGFQTKMHIIRVETASRLCMGRTCPNLMYSMKKDPPNVNVVRSIDESQVQAAIGEMLQ